ncbi:acetate--CoA ligase family protein [Novosphingobium sp. ST904]|uniref:acetate--CoA ligase family protein n=1 Tax=Novosphingobium sp. ST904 TaxID=1684385 RepID=UPI000AE12E64|nr:acetate--CoA ligase family protein [Novosphingobium sp. ST904]TCM41265.1 acyl-CoA synthetase (NDP forming) [Novosphingobium sp. ST904]
MTTSGQATLSQPEQPAAIGASRGGLDALFAPRSIALVGASDDAARIGGRPLKYLRASGFSGPVYPVNPKRETVQGEPAYASLSALPEAPDLALLAVPAAATRQAVEDCVAAGVKAAIVFAAGFAEMGEEGRAEQARIVDIARARGLRLLGPNCLGAADSSIGYYGTFSVMLDDGFLEPGPVAIVSQSGAYGSHIAQLARSRGLGIRHWITTGNECDVDMAEALRWVVDREGVKVVMAYAEGVRNRALFFEALDVARRRGIGVVLVKVGRSEVGAHAVGSHTAALAGSDAVFDAICRQFGAHRARSTAEQIDVAYALARAGVPEGDKLGIFSMSGGLGIQMADDADEAGLAVTPMPEAAQAELKALLPYASPVNPIDATAQAMTDLPLMTRYIRTVMEQGGYDIFVAVLGTAPALPSYSARLAEALDAAATGHDGIIKAVTMSAPQDVVHRYEERGFLVFEDSAALTRALGALVHFRRSFARAASHAEPVPPLPSPVEASGALSEHGAKRVLAAAGMTFPDERLAGDADDAVIAARAIGFPVVLKICSPDIAHKTEVGGVAVNVKDEAAVREATGLLIERARAAVPGARIEGVLVAPMVAGGVEVIAGVSLDPTLGPVVMFGLGGILVEVLKDVSFRAVPFSADEARRMIAETNAGKVLQGVRGAPPSDIDALAETLAALSRFAAANQDRLAGVDINPIRVMPVGEGVVPLDALVLLSR